MSIIILRAKHTANPDGLPDEWPVQKKPLDGPIPPNWEQTTLEGLAAIKESMSAEYEAWKVAHAEAKAQRLAMEELLNISFEEMPAKLPGLAWFLIENSEMTEDEKDAVILSDALNNFHRFLRNGFVAKGVMHLNTAPVPEGVDPVKWQTLLAQVNQVMENAG